MPDDPDYLCYQTGVQGYSYVYGVEYHSGNGPLSAVNEHNVPCAVCYASTTVAVTMIPAKTCSPSTWTLGTPCQQQAFIVTTLAPCMSVLTRTQTQYQELLPVLILPCSTVLKLTAMEWLVHLTTHGKITCAVCTK